MLPNFADRHPDSNSTGESPMTAIWSASWVKVLGTAYTPRGRHQNCSLGVPACNPKPQTDININFPANCSSWFMLIFFFSFLFIFFFFNTVLFVLSCRSWDVVDPLAWLARHSPGAQQFQDSLSVLSMVLLGLHSQQEVVRAVSRQVRTKTRGLLCFLVSEHRTCYFHLISWTNWQWLSEDKRGHDPFKNNVSSIC